MGRICIPWQVPLGGEVRWSVSGSTKAAHTIRCHLFRTCLLGFLVIAAAVVAVFWATEDLGELPRGYRQLCAAATRASQRIFQSTDTGPSDGTCAVIFPEDVEQTLKFVNEIPPPLALGSFADCALVGSSFSLKGRGLGPQIDSHCPVIRVNRLPTEQYLSDFGHLTHLLYGNSFEAKYNVSLLSAPFSNCPANASDPKCYPGMDCRVATPGCPTGGITFGYLQNCLQETTTWYKAPIPVSCVSRHLHEFTEDIDGGLSFEYRGNRTSGGMTAFLALTPYCRKVTMYGFSGTGSADGHSEDFRHSFAKEHGLYSAVQSGEVTAEMLTGNLSRRSGEGPARHRRRVALAKWLALKLSVMTLRMAES